jgi:hypothetical protein
LSVQTMMKIQRIRRQQILTLHQTTIQTMIHLVVMM